MHDASTSNKADVVTVSSAPDAAQLQDTARQITKNAKHALERKLLDEWAVATKDCRPRPTVAEISWAEGSPQVVER